MELVESLRSAKKWSCIFEHEGEMRIGQSDAPFKAADEITRLTEALRLIVGNANEAMPFGPFDCIDNEGAPYQSQAFQDALEAGRKLLARQALGGNQK